MRSRWRMQYLLVFSMLLVAASAAALLGRFYNSLVELKGETLQVQAETIAAVISAAARPGDNALPPENIAPILRRLVPGPHVRARVYARDGALLVDTAGLPVRERTSRVLEQAWAGALYRLMRGETPIYREGLARPTAEPEVRTALQQSAPIRTLVIEDGMQVVTVAMPIRYRSSVQGVLLLSTRAGT